MKKNKILLIGLAILGILYFMSPLSELNCMRKSQQPALEKWVAGQNGQDNDPDSTPRYPEFTATCAMACAGQGLDLDFTRCDTVIVSQGQCVQIILQGTGIGYIATPEAPNRLTLYRVSGAMSQRIGVQLMAGFPACQCN